MSPAYWIGNQAIVQRSLGARSEFEAKASYIWGAVLKNIIPLIVAVPGLLAVALLPDLPDGDAAIPNLVGVLLPAGLRGLFVAAFLAALMSSIDSYLNSSATIVSNDFYQRFIDREVTEEQLLRVGRWTTIVLVAWALFFAFLLTRLQEGSGIYAIFQTLMAFFQGPAFAVLVIGVLWPRATGKAAFVALLCGIVVSITLYALNQPAVYQSLGWRPLFQIADPYLYSSIWAFAATACVLVVGSLLGGPAAPEQLRYVFGGYAHARPLTSGRQPSNARKPRGVTLMTPLHDVGDWFRRMLIDVPLPAVRVLFVGTLLVVLIWVLRLPASAATPVGGAKRWDENLKIGAVLALLIQIVIYLFL